MTASTATFNLLSNYGYQEPGETFSTAFDLGFLNGNLEILESVGNGDSNDVYQFAITQGGDFSLLLDGLNADADVEIYDQYGELIASSINGGTEAEYLSGTIEPGTYYVNINSYDGVGTNYNLQLATENVSGSPNGGEFNIELIAGQGSEYFSQEMVDGILEAAEFWENTISGSSLGGDHDLTIEVGGVAQEWGVNGGVLASAGIQDTVTDSNGNLMPVTGVSFVNIDPDAIQHLSSDSEYFTRVMIHEFGHVMGIGSLWDENNLIDYSTGTYYADTYAGQAYGYLLGTNVPTAIPLTQGEGAGSDWGHWDEDIFDNELMTHEAENSGSMPLSYLTLGSLQDIGWNVDYSAVENYPDGFTNDEIYAVGATDSACGCGVCAGCGGDFLNQNLLDAIAIDNTNTLN